jgi:exonuclease SbcD
MHSQKTTMEPIRLLHFADLHIGMENFGQIDPATGVNTRVLDFIARLKDVATQALDRVADVVIFAGDAFKTRDPNPTYQREFARQIKRMADAGITVVLLVGNHDVPLVDKRASSVDIFRTLDVPNVIVGNGEALHRIETRRGPLQIGTLPWPQRTRLAQDESLRGLTVDQLDREVERLVENRLAALAKEVDPALPAVLTGHFTVAGSVYGSERNVMIGRDAVVSLGALTDPAWDYVALGHIHKHQSLNGAGYPAVVYSGSLERIDFGEERDPKGYCWVEVTRGQTRWEFVPLQVRRFVTINADATDDGDTPTEAVLRAIAREDIEDAVVRVRVKLLQRQELLFKVREVEAALSAARHVVGIGREVERDQRQRLGIDNPESLTPPELLSAYLRSKVADPERRAELMRVAADFIQPNQHA